MLQLHGHTDHRFKVICENEGLIIKRCITPSECLEVIGKKESMVNRVTLRDADYRVDSKWTRVSAQIVDVHAIEQSIQWSEWDMIINDPNEGTEWMPCDFCFPVFRDPNPILRSRDNQTHICLDCVAAMVRMTFES